MRRGRHQPRLSLQLCSRISSRRNLSMRPCKLSTCKHRCAITAIQANPASDILHSLRRDTLLVMQVGCQCLRDSIGDADSGKDSGRFARFDGACLRLSEMSKAGKLPGTFFGRICNVAHVSGLDAAAAVSAVAKEAINLVSSPFILRMMPLPLISPITCMHLRGQQSYPSAACTGSAVFLQATTFVVGNRKCAEHVLEYLGRNQIGVATCLIAEEMPSSNARYSYGSPLPMTSPAYYNCLHSVASGLAAAHSFAASCRASSFADSLEGLVSVGANAELQGVVTKLFGTWHLVNTRSGIQALFQQLMSLPAFCIWPRKC